MNKINAPSQYHKNILCILICLLFFSCTSNSKRKKTLDLNFGQPNYEYIIKNDKFINDNKNLLPGSFISLSKGNTYYEIANSNSNYPAIILIHGFSVPSYIWEPTFQEAKKLGYKVMRFDLYGRGYSQNPDVNYTDELFANQSWELLDSLDINNVVLIGLSNGGRVISKMASIFPNRIDKLIYVSSNGFDEVKELDDKSVNKEEVTRFIKNYKSLSESQKNDFKDPNQFGDWVLKYSKLQKYKGFARALISTQKNHVSLDNLHKEIAETNIEIFTLWGKYDKVVVFDEIREKINKVFPNRKDFFFKNAGHLPQMESRNEFNNVLFNNILKFTKEQKK